MTLETWFKNLELFKPDWNVCKTTENKFTFSYILYILNSLDLTLQKESKKKKIFELCKNPDRVRFSNHKMLNETFSVIFKQRALVLKALCSNNVYKIQE